MKFYLTYILFLSLVLIYSCSEQESPTDIEDILLAEVYGEKLYFSEIEPAVQEELSSEDSIQFTRAIVEEWVRDAILLREAEQNISSDLNIQQMVEDYRSSLIMMNFTQKMIHENLDTIVERTELEAYYSENSEQYILEEPVVRALFLKVDNDHEELEEIKDLWKKEKWPEISLLVGEDFEIKLMDEEQWFAWKDINALIPNGLWRISEIRQYRPLSQASGNHNYFLKMFEFVDEKEIAPLNYIEDQALKVILHKRQTELLDELREELYQKYANRNQIKIHI